MSKNFISGLIAIVLGVIYLVTALSFPELSTKPKVGPEAFPLLVAVIMILSGAALCINDRRSGKADPVEWNFVKERDVWIKIVLTMVMGVIYGLVLDSLGYLLTTAVFMFCATMLINKGRLVQNIIISLLFSSVTYGAFAVVLQLSLPRGIIENMLPF